MKAPQLLARLFATLPPPRCQLPLQVETQRFNATYARKDERTPLVEFLMLAATKARAMYGTAYAELARQVGWNRRETPCVP